MLKAKVFLLILGYVLVASSRHTRHHTFGALRAHQDEDSGLTENAANDEEPLTADWEIRVCLFNDNCHRNVVFCPKENCCGTKTCIKGGECTMELSQCYKETYMDLPDNLCTWELNCYRNSSSCGSGDGCCSTKYCYDGDCTVEIPECIEPVIEELVEPEPIVEEWVDEELTELYPFLLERDIKRICLFDDDCHKNVVFCPKEDCCGVKTCKGGDCTMELSQCYRETYMDIPDAQCTWEVNCYRNVSCHGTCCDEKFCSGGDCSVAIPECVEPISSYDVEELEYFEEVFEEPTEEQGDPFLSDWENRRICLFDDDCHRNVVFCPKEDCCGVKTCKGGDCTMELSQCYRETYMDIPDSQCSLEDNCYRNVSCYDTCCGEKYCSGGYCAVAVPECVEPLAPVEEFEDFDEIYEIYEEPTIEQGDPFRSEWEIRRICLFDDDCHRDVVFCPKEDCCGVKTCKGGDCTMELSQCYRETYMDIPDAQCSLEDNCYKNVSCHGTCCDEKYCSHGECSVAIPECVEPISSYDVEELEYFEEVLEEPTQEQGDPLKSVEIVEEPTEHSEKEENKPTCTHRYGHQGKHKRALGVLRADCKLSR